jgi:hypothetical protein
MSDGKFAPDVRAFSDVKRELPASRRRTSRGWFRRVRGTGGPLESPADDASGSSGLWYTAPAATLWSCLIPPWSAFPAASLSRRCARPSHSARTHPESFILDPFSAEPGARPCGGVGARLTA